MTVCGLETCQAQVMNPLAAVRSLEATLDGRYSLVLFCQLGGQLFVVDHTKDMLDENSRLARIASMQFTIDNLMIGSEFQAVSRFYCLCREGNSSIAEQHRPAVVNTGDGHLLREE